MSPDIQLTAVESDVLRLLDTAERWLTEHGVRLAIPEQRPAAIAGAIDFLVRNDYIIARAFTSFEHPAYSVTALGQRALAELDTPQLRLTS